MKPSRYLERFKKLAEEGSDAFTLSGDMLIIERIPEEELKTATGIIIASGWDKHQVSAITADRPCWVRVLAAGAGYYSQHTDAETGEIIEKSVPLDARPGDIVLVGQAGVKWFGIFAELKGYEADSIGLTRESEVQLRFKGQEGYDKAVALLNDTSATAPAGATS